MVTGSNHNDFVDPRKSGFSAGWKQCGNWQQEYAHLHREIVAGKAAQRYMIAKPSNGLADSLACAVTVLYIAVLTGHAFLLRDVDDMKSTLTYGYDEPNIEWSAEPAGLEDLSTVHLGQFVTWNGDPAFFDIIRCESGAFACGAAHLMASPPFHYIQLPHCTFCT